MPRRKPKPPVPCWRIRVGEQFVWRFTYPENVGTYPRTADKGWERSDGVKIAMCCKAVLGDEAFLWTREESARHCARDIPDAIVEVGDDQGGSWTAVGPEREDRGGHRVQGAPEAGIAPRSDAASMAVVADGDGDARDGADDEALLEVRAGGALQADLFAGVSVASRNVGGGGDG
jgi:hypothetical protein